MKQRIIVGVFGLLGCLQPGLGFSQEAEASSSSASRAQASSRSVPQSLRLEGSLIDEQGGPVAGASVRLLAFESDWQSAANSWRGEEPAPLAQTRTRSDGSFAVTTEGPGFLRLDFSANGFAPVTWSPRAPVLQSRVLLPIEMKSPRTMKVRTIDGAGRPIAAARLKVTVVPERVGFGAATRRARDLGAAVAAERTDETGSASFSIGAQSGTLGVAAVGFLPQQVSFDEGAGSLEETVTLEAASSVPVQLTMPDGSAAAEAIVLLKGAVVGFADVEGLVQLPSSDSSTEFAVIAKQSLVGARFTADLLRAGAETPRVRLQEPSVLSGRVVNADLGTPLANAWVWTRRTQVTRTEEDGSYRLRNPAYASSSRTRALWAVARNYFAKFERFTAGERSESTGPTLALDPAAVLVGEVVDAQGQAVADVVLKAVVKDFAAIAGRGRDSARAVQGASRADGSFRLGPLPPSTALELTARSERFAVTKQSLDPLTPGKEHRLRVVLLTGARAYGRVVDESEVPIPDARVTITETVGAQDVMSIVSRRFAQDDPLEVFTDAQGDFRIEALAAGSYDLEVEAPRFAPAKVQAVEVPSAEQLRAEAPEALDGNDQVAPAFELGTVTLSPGAVIEGTVKSKDGQSVEGAEIRISEVGNTSVMMRSMIDSGEGPDLVSDGTGRFVFDSLAENATYKIDVESEGFAGATVPNVKAPTEQPLEIVLEPASAVRGVVRNQLGDPLEGASVRINVQMGSIAGGMMNINPQRMFKNATTDDEGRFEIVDLGAGKWDLAVSSPTYIDYERQGLELVAGRDPADLDIVLEKGAVLVGNVVGADGKALVGALIERVVSRRGMFDTSQTNRRMARTDGDGNYRIEGLPLGGTSFTAKHDRHQEQVRDHEVLAGDNRLDFRMERGLVIRGRVLEPTGLGIGGARVEAKQPGNPMAVILSGGRRGGTVSQEDGSYELEGLSSGTYRVVATKEGYADGQSAESVVLEGSDAVGIDVQLETGAAITGIVTGLGYDELAQVQVMAMQPGQTSNPLMAQLNYDGEYRIDNVAAGDWMVMAMVGQGRNQRETITIDPGQFEMVVDFDFGGGFTLSGRVLRNGQPEAGVMVLAAGTTSAGSGQATTGPDGDYVIEGLEPGGYRVVVTNFSQTAHEETIELAASQTLDIQILDASITGRVVDARTGAPLSGVELSLTRTDNTDSPFGGFVFVGLGGGPRTDEAGQFRVERVVAGEYRLTGNLEGYGAGTIDFAVDTTDLNGLELSMEPAVSLTVTVLQPSGGPARQVSFSVLDAAGRAVLNSQRTLAEGGRLDIESLPDGNYDLLVAEGGGATARQAVSVPGDSVTVRLPRSGQLRLLIPELSQSQLGARVLLIDDQGRRYQGAGLQGLLNAANAMVLDGRALLPAVPVGVWTVRVETLDQARTWETVARVVEGTEVEYVVE